MEEARPIFCDASRSQGNASPSSRRTSGGPTYSQTLRCTSIWPTSSQSCSMGARHGPSARPWQSVSTPSTPGVCGKFYEFRTPDTLQVYKLHGQEHHGLLASLWKGQVVPFEVFRALARSAPEEDHHPVIAAATTTWLADTSWSSEIHLAESDRWRRSAPELWGHSLEEGKGQGYLASSRQYGNALLGVRH